MVKTGKPGVLQSMGLQGVGHNLATGKQQPTNNDSSKIVQQLKLFPDRESFVRWVREEEWGHREGGVSQ